MPTAGLQHTSKRGGKKETGGSSGDCLSHKCMHGSEAPDCGRRQRGAGSTRQAGGSEQWRRQCRAVQRRGSRLTAAKGPAPTWHQLLLELLSIPQKLLESVAHILHLRRVGGGGPHARCHTAHSRRPTHQQKHAQGSIARGSGASTSRRHCTLRWQRAPQPTQPPTWRAARKGVAPALARPPPAPSSPACAPRCVRACAKTRGVRRRASSPAAPPQPPVPRPWGPVLTCRRTSKRSAPA